jgi:hypothetical protein
MPGRRDYEIGKTIARNDFPFYALIQAAMRQADSTNAMHLKAAFPAEWAELQARYHAPGGRLDGDPYYHGATEEPNYSEQP